MRKTGSAFGNFSHGERGRFRHDPASLFGPPRPDRRVARFVWKIIRPARRNSRAAPRQGAAFGLHDPQSRRRDITREHPEIITARLHAANRAKRQNFVPPSLAASSGVRGGAPFLSEYFNLLMFRASGGISDIMTSFPVCFSDRSSTGRHIVVFFSDTLSPISC